MIAGNPKASVQISSTPPQATGDLLFKPGIPHPGTITAAPLAVTGYRYLVTLYAAAFLLLIYLVAFVSPRGFVYDETMYMRYVAVLHQYGLSANFLLSLPGGAGPLHGVIQWTFERVTLLQPVRTRFVSLFCFLLTASLVFLTCRALGYRYAAALSLSAITVPMNWVIAGLTLTEAPAVFFATASFCCLALSRSDRPARPLWWQIALVMASGGLMSIAIMGRQPFLLLVIVPLCVAVVRRENPLPPLLYICMAVLPALPIFLIWEGVSPPFQQSFEHSGQGPIVLLHALYSLGYAGIVVLIVAPGFLFIRQLRYVIALSVSLIILNAAFGMFVKFPFMLSAENHLSPGALDLYGRLAGGFLLAFCLLFSVVMIVRTWESRDDFTTLTAALSFWIICLTPALIPHQYSSRYTTVSWPFMLFAVRNHFRVTGWTPLLASAGAALGVAALLGYY